MSAFPARALTADTPPSTTPAAPRFTVDGSPALEARLAIAGRRIAAGIRGLIPARLLEGALLGGGYGRGEGGVLRAADGDLPYNDVEVYVMARGNRHLNEFRFGKALGVLGEILSPQVGAEVEFKLTSRAELRAAPVSMFSYDLVSGHRWLIGGEHLLADCAHHERAEAIPLAEATRLLMNRASGLLFARERLLRPVFTATDGDFVHRNLAKAELALGDAVLAAEGQYHWSCRERHRRLRELPVPDLERCCWSELCARHAAATEFKLHPVRSGASREHLGEAWAQVNALAWLVWQLVEGQRLNAQFVLARDYALGGCSRWPETSVFWNCLVNAKCFGPRVWLARGGGCHPRERLLRALALLAWEPAALTDRALMGAVQRLLQTSGTTLRELLPGYQRLWAAVR